MSSGAERIGGVIARGGSPRLVWLSRIVATSADSFAVFDSLFFRQLHLPFGTYFIWDAHGQLVYGGVAPSATVQTCIKSHRTLRVSTHRMAAPARFAEEPSPHRAMRHSDPIEVLGEIS